MDWGLSSFDTLKEQLTAMLLLARPDLTRQMTLYTNTKVICIGACLIQIYPEQDNPIPGINSDLFSVPLNYFQLNRNGL